MSSQAGFVEFFDRVNHDKLMSIIARVIDDKPMPKLIRRYLSAGIMENGLGSPREEGIPQGILSQSSSVEHHALRIGSGAGEAWSAFLQTHGDHFIVSLDTP